MRRSFSAASAASRSRTRSARNACTRSRSPAPASPPAEERLGAAGRLDRLDPGDRVAAAGAGPLAPHGGLGEGPVDRRSHGSLAPPSLAVHPAPAGRADQRGREHRRGQGERQQATPALARRRGPRPGPGPARPPAAAPRRPGGRPSARRRPRPRPAAGPSARRPGTTAPGATSSASAPQASSRARASARSARAALR